MSWDRLIGRVRTTETLSQAVSTGRVAQAYLFHGPDGTGKRAAALAFAQALQCERSRSREAGANASACGRCLACTKAARGMHPDIHVYLPYPKGGREDSLPADYCERLQQLWQNPYAPIDYRRLAKLGGQGQASNKQVEYRLKQLETLRHEVGFQPTEGTYAVGIMLQADAMREKAANAFLKGLEEPPERTVLILLAERADRMLPTVLSRCQRIRFDPLPADAIEVALREREAVPPERAAFVARMADGSYTRALSLMASEDLAERRALALDFLRAAYSGHPNRLAPLVEQIGALGREGVKELFGLLLGWIRDLVLFQATGSASVLVNVDQAEAIGNFVAALPKAHMQGMSDLVEEAIGRIEGNVHTGLVLTVLAHALQEAMHGTPRNQLFAPLTEPVPAS